MIKFFCDICGDECECPTTQIAEIPHGEKYAASGPPESGTLWIQPVIDVSIRLTSVQFSRHKPVDELGKSDYQLCSKCLINAAQQLIEQVGARIKNKSA